ncbi:MAG: hypothetical protein R3C70_14690 [Geminicoccaceae bacterium]|nr:hypothetical protein [Geminicoccaceae bacterium]
MKACVTAFVLTMLLAGTSLAGIDKVRPAQGLQSVGGNAPLRVQCWQEGRMVLEQHGLEGLNMGPLLKDSTLQLRRRGEQATSLVITHLGDSLCIVTSLPD